TLTRRPHGTSRPSVSRRATIVTIRTATYPSQPLLRMEPEATAYLPAHSPFNHVVLPAARLLPTTASTTTCLATLSSAACPWVQETRLAAKSTTITSIRQHLRPSTSHGYTIARKARPAV